MILAVVSAPSGSDLLQGLQGSRVQQSVRRQDAAIVQQGAPGAEVEEMSVQVADPAASKPLALPKTRLPNKKVSQTPSPARSGLTQDRMFRRSPMLSASGQPRGYFPKRWPS